MNIPRRSFLHTVAAAARHGEAASGHERIDTPVPGRFHTYPEMAAAGLWTTAPELARWATWHHARTLLSLVAFACSLFCIRRDASALRRDT